MAETPKKESTWLLWLEVLPGWVLPVAGIGGALVIVLLFATGSLSDHIVATVIAMGTAVGLCIALGVPGLRSAIPWVRPATIAGCALCAGLVLYGFFTAVYPGAPVAVKSLTPSDNKLLLPGPGAYRLLVSGALKATGEVRGDYVLKAGGREIRGSIDRSFGRRSARRGASVIISQDHTSNFHSVTVGTPAEIVLARLGPEIKDEVSVAAHRALPPWLLIAAVAAAVALTAVIDALVGAKGRCALVGPTAGIFVPMMSMVVPDRTLGPTVGAALLSVAAGGILGSGTWRIARALVPKPKESKQPKAKRKEKQSGHGGASSVA